MEHNFFKKNERAIFLIMIGLTEFVRFLAISVMKKSRKKFGSFFKTLYICTHKEQR